MKTTTDFKRLVLLMLLVTCSYWLGFLQGSADAAAPNGMPNATVDQLATVAFSLSAGPHTESKTTVADCRRRDAGGWRCDATYRWKPAGAATWSNVCPIRLYAWNAGGYADPGDVAACDGLLEADVTPRR